MKKLLTGLLVACFGALQASQVLVEDNFQSTDGSKWQEMRLMHPFSLVTYSKAGLTMSRNEKQEPIKGRLFDTAFELKGIQKAIPAGATDFDLSIQVGTNRGDFTCKGYHDGYHNRILWYDKDGKRMEDSFYYKPSFRFSLEHPGWSTFRGKIPAGAAKAEVQFGFDGPDFQPGEKAVLSGLKLTVGTAKEIAALEVLGTMQPVATLISKTPTEDANAPVVITVTNAKGVDWKSVSVVLDDKDITAEIKRNDTTLTYTPKAPLAQGLHFFDVTFSEKGNVEKQTAVLFIGKERTEHKMTIRSDGMPLLEGKPFFMLGIACLVKQGRNGQSYDKAFEEASKAGMNFARHWSTYNMDSRDAQEYVAAAKKYNMYISMSTTLSKNDTDIKRIARGVASQLYSAERVLAWDIGDDTSAFITPLMLQLKHNAIHAVDTSRLTTQADGVGGGHYIPKLSDCGNYTEYVKASDTFQPEIYPVGHCQSGTENAELTAKMVPEVIRDMMQIKQDWAKAGVKAVPIWPLIQYFHYDTRGKNWNRMPTAAELRAMSYLAVIHGSHGVFWYRYAGYSNTPNATRGYSDEQWNTLSSISLEFRALYDMYCEMPVEQIQKATVTSGPQKDGLGFNSMNTLLKKYNGKWYLITCNSAMKEVKATFSLKGIKSAKEYYEKRNIKVSKDSFSDDFAPYAVHVYELQ